jgi:cytochrome c
MRYLVLAVLVLMFVSVAYAAGNAERGQELFTDQSFAGSKNARSCNTCHPGGKGLEGSGTKEFTSLMGIRAVSIEDIVNICIERPLEGRAIAHGSEDMKDMVAYIRSLAK